MVTVMFNKNLLPVLVALKKVGFLNAIRIIKLKSPQNYIHKRVVISVFFYKNSPFFGGIRVVSTSSKTFTVRLHVLRILNISLGETILLLETSRGILTHKEAIRLRLGGRVLGIVN